MHPGITLVVVTRLAVRLPGRALPSTDWLTERYRILRALTVPALSSSPVPLSWILTCDPDRLETVAPAAPDLTTTWGPPLVLSDASSPTEVASRLGSAADGPILSIRLDSDDAWLPGALGWMARVGSEARDGTIFDAPHGYQYDTASDTTTSLTFGPSHQGPFLALRHDDASEALDVGGDHRSARAGRPIRRYDRPGWVQVVHGANVANRPVPPPRPREQVVRLIKGLATGPRYAAAWARSGRVTARPAVADALASADPATGTGAENGRG